MSRTIRPSTSTYAVLLCCWVVPGLLAAELGLKLGDWNYLLVMLALLATVLVFIRRTQVSWDDQFLIYRTPFSRKIIRWSEVERYKVGGPDIRRGLKPTVYLDLYCADRREVVSIGIKPFGREDTRDLIEVVKKHGRPH